MMPSLTVLGTKKRVPVRSTAAIASAGIMVLAAGCGTKSTSLPPVQYLSDTLQQDPPATADLTKPFAASVADLEQGEDAGLPVAAAKAFASSAGGTWVRVTTTNCKCQ
jgi:hypothetical protein